MHAQKSCRYIVLLLALVWYPSVSAVSLPPGQSSTTGPVPLAGVTPPPGTVLDSLTYVFELRDDQDPSIILATGNVDSRVVREDGTELLRFEYQLFVDEDSPGNVEFLVLRSFGDFQADVDFVLGGTGDVMPDGANRGGLDFNVISFFMNRFSSGTNVNPGESSLPVFVRTNATLFDTNGAIQVQQGLDTEVFRNAFQPTVVPLPGAFLLFNLGLVAIGLIGRKRSGRNYKLTH